MRGLKLIMFISGWLLFAALNNRWQNHLPVIVSTWSPQCEPVTVLIEVWFGRVSLTLKIESDRCCVIVLCLDRDLKNDLNK